MEPITDDKYMVMKVEDFYAHWGRASSVDVNKYAIRDAVVIRRQDLFASPCLATYASMISLVAKNHSDPEVSKELLAIADYFEDQAQLAAEEGWKLPTL